MDKKDNSKTRSLQDLANIISETFSEQSGQYDGLLYTSKISYEADDWTVFTIHDNIESIKKLEIFYLSIPDIKNEKYLKSLKKELKSCKNPLRKKQIQQEIFELEKIIKKDSYLKKEKI